MNDYPIHWSVFENDASLLKEHLAKTSKNDLDKKDLRNKTALELAIMLNNYECAKLLVEHGADCNLITKTGWNLVQEAVSTGNSKLIKLILTYRDFQRHTARTNGIPEMLSKLKQSPDFYVEMKWQFTSWIPLISKACPSDVYKIYKSGSNVRIDTTLIGFNGTSWERGNRSYIFQATESGSATIIEIDHILKTYHVDKLTSIDPFDSNDLEYYEPDNYVIQNKLTSPNIVTFLDIEKIEFERNRSGIFGWRADKYETINGYDCKVFSANNLQLITKTRVEHLNNELAQNFVKELGDNDEHDDLKQSNVPVFIANFFQGNEKQIKIEKSNKNLSALEYFQKQYPVDYYLNGSIRRIDETQKIQTFVANLSLSDSYPLSLHEQLLPIVDLMALNNSHFKKLKEFITLQLPSGFPVKIEIPLYRVITAKVTFGNIHAIENHVKYVTTIKNSDDKPSHGEVENLETDSLIKDQSEAVTSKLKANQKLTCSVDEYVFKIPSDYRCTNSYIPSPIESSSLIDQRRNIAGASNVTRYHYNQFDEDDIQIQIAIQQSIASMKENSQSVDSKRSFFEDSPGTQSLDEYNNKLYNNENLMLQRVLEQSLHSSNQSRTNMPSSSNFNIDESNEDDSLRAAIEISKQEEVERILRIQREEEEILNKIIQLSLVEK